MLLALSKFNGSQLVQMPFNDVFSEDLRVADARTLQSAQHEIAKYNITEENEHPREMLLQEKQYKQEIDQMDMDEPQRPQNNHQSVHLTKEVNFRPVEVNVKVEHEQRPFDNPIVLSKKDKIPRVIDSDSEEDVPPNPSLKEVGRAQSPPIYQNNPLPKRLNFGGAPQPTSGLSSPKIPKAISLTPTKAKPISFPSQSHLPQEPQRTSMLGGVPKLDAVHVQDIELDAGHNVQPKVKLVEGKKPKLEIQVDDKLAKIDIRDEKDNADSEEDDWNIKGENQKPHVKPANLGKPKNIQGLSQQNHKPVLGAKVENNSANKRNEVADSWVFG